MLVRSIAQDMHDYRQIEEDVRAEEEEARRRDRVAYFHRLKKSPEASDPESSVAERVRRLSQQRRAELGRPGKERRDPQ